MEHPMSDRSHPSTIARARHRLARALPVIAVLTAAFAASPGAAGAVAMPAGRIAITHDGNQHDPDDWGATAMDCALIGTAGLAGRLVHFDYSNHLGDSDAAFEAEMSESALGGAARFGLDSTRFFDCQGQLDQAIANFRSEANRSSATDPLWFICAGPMETAWRCVAAVDPAKRGFIHVVSHSAWNDEHGDTPQMTHDWADLVALGVTAHHLVDQNDSDGQQDWNTDEQHWYWLRDSSDADLRWLHSRDQLDGYTDYSDSGMTWWLITGGPGGGDQRAGWPEAQALLAGSPPGANGFTLIDAGSDRPVAGFDPVNPGAVIDPAAIGTQALTLRANIASAGSVAFAIDGRHERTENVAPFALSGDNGGDYAAWSLQPGQHTVTATPYSGANGSGAVGETRTLTFTIAAPGGAASAFTLINADSDTPVPGFAPLTVGAVIDPGALGTYALTVRADLVGVGSVRFTIDGRHERTENVAPYALSGDVGGDYAAWSLAPGQHTVTATPYSGANGSGTAGQVRSVTFTIVVPGGNG